MGVSFWPKTRKIAPPRQPKKPAKAVPRSSVSFDAIFFAQLLQPLKSSLPCLPKGIYCKHSFSFSIFFIHLIFIWPNDTLRPPVHVPLPYPITPQSERIAIFSSEIQNLFRILLVKLLSWGKCSKIRSSNNFFVLHGGCAIP